MGLKEIPLIGAVIEGATDWYNQKSQKRRAAEGARIAELLRQETEKVRQRENEELERLIRVTMEDIESGTHPLVITS